MVDIAARGISATGCRLSGKTRKRRPGLAIPTGGWFQSKLRRSSEVDPQPELDHARSGVLRVGEVRVLRRGLAEIGGGRRRVGQEEVGEVEDVEELGREFDL